MTMEECYRKLGGDYSEVLGRMMNESFIRKFIRKFLEDDSFALLEDAMQKGDCKEAFRGAHTLKGVCQNLGFGTLAASASCLTEILRPLPDSIPEEAGAAMKKVREDYQKTTEIIRTFLEEA